METCNNILEGMFGKSNNRAKFRIRRPRLQFKYAKEDERRKGEASWTKPSNNHGGQKVYKGDILLCVEFKVDTFCLLGKKV